VRSLVGEGVEVIVSSDHDFVFDYAPVLTALGVDDRATSMVGVEVTPSADDFPWAPPFPRAHVNGWPVQRDPDARKNGAPESRFALPATIYDRLRSLGAQVVQLNHPVWSSLGYLHDIGYDPGLPIDVPPNSTLLQTSALGTGTRHIDFDAIEVQNGIDATTTQAGRTAWMSLLSQGYLKTGTAASDSHVIGRTPPGIPRTWVAYPGGPQGFDPAAFNDSLLAMRAIGSAGPFIEVEARHDGAVAGLGETLSAPQLELWVRVQAPCWMPVDFVRIWANGVLAVETTADPVCTSALRFEQTFPLAPSVDTHYEVTVDQDPARPLPTTFEEALFVYAYPVVVFDAFTNPIFVDVDGNGVFDAPGVGGP
jgi:hypothetical protein